MKVFISSVSNAQLQLFNKAVKQCMMKLTYFEREQ